MGVRWNYNIVSQQQGRIFKYLSSYSADCSRHFRWKAVGRNAVLCEERAYVPLRVAPLPITCEPLRARVDLARAVPRGWILAEHTHEENLHCGCEFVDVLPVSPGVILTVVPYYNYGPLDCLNHDKRNMSVK